MILNAEKRKVPLRILLQRVSVGERKQRILKGKWPWSGAPTLLKVRLQRVHPL